MQGDELLYHRLVLNFQWICMAGRWRMLLVPGFSDCSWAEHDVDRGWSVIKRNVLELVIYLWRDIFEPYIPPWVVRELGGRKPP